MPDRCGQRKTRDQLSRRRVPELGYYYMKIERYNPAYNTKDNIIDLPACSKSTYSSSQGRVRLGDLGYI